MANMIKSKENLRSKGTLHILRKQINLQLMVLPALIYLIIFSYVPILGLQIAFKDFKFNKGIWGSTWVGLKHFEAIFTDPNIGQVLLNTLIISFMKAFLIFPLPIIFALLLNEVRNSLFKRTVQTISYFPYFISWSIVALMATNWLSPQSGFINSALLKFGLLKEPYFFLGRPEAFWWVSLGLEVWKNLGYASIIYLAAISAVDHEIIEASVIDGANRFGRIWYVIIPSILPTIMILLILNIGNLLGGGLYASNFQISYTLGNSLNLPTSEILDTYFLKTGISLSRFSYATAIGLLSSVVSALLLLTANFFSRITTGESYF
jgi:putative aldouronate transport system permease protein